MKKHKPILRILASHDGVYEVGVRAPAAEYDNAERLSAAIKPAIAIIDEAIREVYSGARIPLCRTWRASASHGVGE